MLENLPSVLHWNVLKYLRHPLANILVKTKAYNHFIVSQGDTFTNVRDETFGINDLIPFVDVWKYYKRKPERVIYRVITFK